jgi:hypothetical protein
LAGSIGGDGQQNGISTSDDRFSAEISGHVGHVDTVVGVVDDGGVDHRIAAV